MRYLANMGFISFTGRGLHTGVMKRTILQYLRAACVFDQG